MKKKILFLLILFINISHVYTQQNSLPIKWTELGPFSIWGKHGRVNCIAFHPTDENIIYAGTPTGGLWQTVNGGKSWFPKTDYQINNGVSAIAIDYSNTDIMYIGTGDKAGQPYGKIGTGIYKSIDKGKTWKSINNNINSEKIYDIKIHPTNPEIIFCVNNSSKILKSTNSGKTWSISQKAQGNKEIVFHPTNPNILYTSTSKGYFYKSTNCGSTWSKRTSGIEKGKMKIAVTKANPSIVYCMIDKKGLYKSTDNGENFTKISDCNYDSFFLNSFYNFCFAVSHTNPNILFLGTVYLWRSIDGGKTWVKKTGTHVDNHHLLFSPITNNLYSANDGGICYSSNNADTWHDINKNLNITQIYFIGQNKLGNSVLIGTQDNGVSLWRKNLFTNTVKWKNIFTSDVKECIASEYLFFEINNSILRAKYYGHTKTIARPGKNGIDKKESKYQAFALDNQNNDIMYVCFSNLYKCENINVADEKKIKWIKITDFQNKKSGSIIEQSKANSNIVYIKKGNEFLFRTDNFKATKIIWTQLKSPNNNWIKDIKAHPKNENIVYTIVNKKIWKSTNKGETWFDYSFSLPEIVYTKLAVDENSPESIYLGSENGVFYKNENMSDWVSINGNLPKIRVTDLEILQAKTIYFPQLFNAKVDTINIKGKLRVGTYGRGLWEMDLLD